MSEDGKKKKKNLAAKAKTGIKAAKGAAAAVNITKTYVLPVLLVAFAIVAYAVYDVAIPKD